MSTKTNGVLKTTNDYVGRRVLVEREVIEVEEIQGHCLEVVDSGMLVRYSKRGQDVTEFFPWAHVKRVRHMESVKAQSVAEET